MALRTGRGITSLPPDDFDRLDNALSAIAYDLIIIPVDPNVSSFDDTGIRSDAMVRDASMRGLPLHTPITGRHFTTLSMANGITDYPFFRTCGDMPASGPPGGVSRLLHRIFGSTHRRARSEMTAYVNLPAEKTTTKKDELRHIRHWPCRLLASIL